MRSILITGTDTGVGKTFITYNIALTLKEKNIRVGYFKPVETGVENIPQDGNLLAKVTGQELAEVVPFRYRKPLSPYAAQLEGEQEINIKTLHQKYDSLKEKYEILLVEGAGGIAVPLKRNYTYADLAKDWQLEVIVVARAGLGTLNHTFLTVFYARNLGLNLKGIVLNGFEGKDPSEKMNPLIVEEMTGFKPVCISKTNSLVLSKTQRELLLELIGF